MAHSVPIGVPSIAAGAAQLTKAKTRPAIIHLSLFTLRFIGQWVQVLRQLSSEEADLETWLIVISVTAIGAGRFARGGLEADLQDLAAAMPQGRLGRCNLRSIAAATGLNREKVRRKVNWLVAAGILEREANGAIRVTAAIAARPEVQKLVLKQADTIRQLSAELESLCT